MCTPACPTAPTCAATPTTTRSTPATPPATGPGSSTSAPATSGSSTTSPPAPCRASWTCGSAARASGAAPTRCRPPATSTDSPSTRRAGPAPSSYAAACTGSPTATAPPAPSPTPRACGSGCPRCSAPAGRSRTSPTRRARTRSRSPTSRARAVSASRAAWRPGSSDGSSKWSATRTASASPSRRTTAACSSSTRPRRTAEEEAGAGAEQTGGEVTELIRSINGPVRDLAFSPDGAWLTWSHPGIGRSLRQIKMARIKDRTIIDVTNGRFEDENPVFTRDGRYLAFLSWRGFDPVYDVHTGDLSFPLGCRPYLVPLSSATPSPFALSPHGRPAAGGLDPTEDSGADGTVRAWRSRVWRTGSCRSPSRRPSTRRCTRSRAAASCGCAGRSPARSARRSSTRPTPRAAPPWSTSTSARARRPNSSPTSTGSRSAATARRLVVVDEGELRAVPSTEAGDSDSTVWIDLRRILHEVDPAAEWRQAYEEAGPHHPRLLLGPEDVRHRLGRGPRPVPAARRTGRVPRRVRRPAARGARRTLHLARLRLRRPPQRGPAPLPARPGPPRRQLRAPRRGLAARPHPARRLVRLQGALPAGRQRHPRGRRPHACRRPPGRPGRRPLPAARGLGRHDGRADVPARGGRGPPPPRRGRPPHRRAPAALPGLGRQTPRGRTGAERRQVRLSAHPRHGRLRLGAVQPRPAHGGLPARPDRRRTRQRGRPHQRAGHREAHPQDPRLGPDPQRPARLVRVERPARSGRRPGRRGDLVRRRHDHRGVQAPRARPGRGPAHLGRRRRHDGPPHNSATARSSRSR